MKSKKVLSVLLSTMVVGTCMPVSVFAEGEADAAGIMMYAAEDKVANFVEPDGTHTDGYAWLQEGQLSSQDGSKDKNLGNGWDDKSEKNTPYEVPMGEDDTFRVWKLEIDGGFPNEATLYFYNDLTQAKGSFTITGFTPSGNGATCQLILPDGYRLVGGYAANCAGIKANYAGRHTPEHSGTVTVNANVTAWHNEITPHEYYERDVDKYYERTVDEYYERTVDKYYERTVDEYYERPVDEYYERTVDEYYERAVDEYYTRPVTEIMQRYAQKYLVPVFEKKMEGAYKDTLVTRLDYSDDTAKATPTNGGAFKNGHTYVTVNVAEASKEGGVWYTIADSSKNNGKKTPDQYNCPIDYKYNVKIADGKLTVSCDDRLAYAGVGAFVYATEPKDAKNAPAHSQGSVTVDLPKGYKDTVYLYTHFEKLGWYAVDDKGDFVYQFKEWKYDDSRTEYDKEYTKIDTVYGDYALANTKYGEYELANTVNGEYELVNTVNGEYELVKTVEGDYELVKTVEGDYELVKTVEGDYELVKTVEGDYELVKTENSSEKVTDVYSGVYTITLQNEAGEIVQAVNSGDELKLSAGTYTLVLSSEGFADVTETVTVAAGESKTVNLAADVQYDDVTLGAVEHKSDREATEHYADLEATEHYADKAATEHYADKAAEKHYADKAAEKHYADKEATKHCADKAAEKHYADAEATQEYKEEFLYKEDIKLGNETDYNGEYAVKWN